MTVFSWLIFICHVLHRSPILSGALLRRIWSSTDVSLFCKIQSSVKYFDGHFNIIMNIIYGTQEQKWTKHRTLRYPRRNKPLRRYLIIVVNILHCSTLFHNLPAPLNCWHSLIDHPLQLFTHIHAQKRTRTSASSCLYSLKERIGASVKDRFYHIARLYAWSSPWCIRVWVNEVQKIRILTSHHCSATPLKGHTSKTNILSPPPLKK